MAKSTVSGANVHVTNLFVLSEEKLSSASNTGRFEVNATIFATALTRKRIGTREVLSDGPSAAIAGVERGAASAATGRQSAALIAGRIAPGAAIAGAINDAVNVGQHVVQGNGAEAVTEGFGVGGQAAGAWAGAQAGGQIGTYLLGPGWGTTAGVLIGTAGGALFGAQGVKSIGAYLTGGDTPDKLGPPLTLPNDIALEPTIVTSDGSRYALVQIEDKYTWFSIQDNPALPNRYVEVVSGTKAAELTGSYLDAAGFGAQLAQRQAELAEQQREALRAAFARSEIESANHMGPNGLPWGTPSAIGSNATQTWLLSPEPSNPDGIQLVATSDRRSVVHWTLDCETGQMEKARVASAVGSTLGWQANLTPAETIQVLQQGIGQGQWNVMQGPSPTGYAVDGVYYEHTGPPTIAGVGSTAGAWQRAVRRPSNCDVRKQSA